MNDKPKIALVCTSLNELGGKNNHLKNIYNHLGQDGLELCIIASSKVEGALKDFFCHGGVKEEDLILVPRWKKWFIVPLVWELRKVFIDRKIDIAHTFQIQSDILGGIAAKMAGVKHLYSYYESKLVPDNISLLKRIPYRVVNCLIKGWFEKTIVVSSGLKNEIIQNSFRKTTSVEVVPLGIDVPDNVGTDVNPRANLVIGTLARYSQEKALDRIINAMPLVLKEIPNAKCVLVGQGPEKDTLQSLADELGIREKVTFKDWTENIWEELANIDIFVMSSKREGCPTSLLEALAAKKAVVVSDIEGVGDIIVHNQEGLIVDVSKKDVFSEAIIFLCKNSNRVKELGLNGQEKVKRVFSMEKEMNSLKRIYLSAK